MVSTSKILTVSYGTFSCTLEGFDDSFDTMKAIAEYFRDLAADDRYFGAEPPTPDAEMLARIAEREIERRVEARLEKGSIILRPSIAAPAKPAPAPKPETVARQSAGTAPAAMPAQSLPETAPAEPAAPTVSTVQEEEAIAQALEADTGAMQPAEAPEATMAEAPAEAAETPATAAASETDMEAASVEATPEETGGDDSVAAASEEVVDAPEAAAAGVEPMSEQPEAAFDELTEADEVQSFEADIAGTLAASRDETEVEAGQETHAGVVARAAVAAGEEEPDLAAEADTPAPAFSNLDEITAGDEDDALRAALSDTLRDAADDLDDMTGEDIDDDEAVAADLADADDAEDAAEEAEAVAEPVPAPVKPAQPVAGSVAAKLQRIRAVVNAARAQSPAGYSEDEHAEEMLPAAQRAKSASVLPAMDFDAGEDTDNAPMAYVSAERAPEAELGAELGADPAADLEADIAGDFAEEAAEDTAEDIAEAAAGDAAEETPDDDRTEAEAEDAALIASLTAAQDAPEAVADEAAEDADDRLDHNLFEDTVDAASPHTHAAPPPLRARVLKVRRSDFEAAVAGGALEEVTGETAEDGSLSPEEEADLARELAEVEAEFDMGPDAAGLDEGEDADADDRLDLSDFVASDSEDAGERMDLDADEPASERLEFDAAPELMDEDEDGPLALEDDEGDRDARDAEDEDEAAMLARLSGNAAAPGTAEDAAPVDETMMRDDARRTLRLGSEARAMLTEKKVGDGEDGDMSRLIDKTNDELDEPVGSRRRNAIAHLRAAVAATKADRVLSKRTDDEDDKEPYRKDLANVVRPRRPQTVPVTRSERPVTMQRPAPLKLVAEQRVDAPAPGSAAAPAEAPGGQIRPRRVTTTELPRGDIDRAEQDGGFAAFAEEMGAHELPDLLEAAAAYMSFVEGRDQFSRPQLMSKVRQAETAESSREDRLRSFGQLLREGKIEKVSGGRFAASDRISFRPDARAAG